MSIDIFFYTQTDPESWCWCVIITWSTYMEYIIDFFSILKDMLLILEHSFYLHQQGHPKPLSLAAERYKAPDSCGRVEKALKGVVERYGKASHGQKVNMVTNVILQNHMCVLIIPFIVLFVDGFPQSFHQLNQDAAGYDFGLFQM